ncbi:MAG: Fic family protein [Acidobacteriota bacterium]
MKINKNKSYNDLPPLPPKVEIDSKTVLNKLAPAHRYLAELKGTAQIIPNQDVLINSIILQEAQSSSRIENVVTTSDKLYKAFSSNRKDIDSQTKEVLKYREALWEGFRKLKKRPVFGTNLFVDIFQTIKQTQEGIRSTSGTRIADTRGRVVYTPPEGEPLVRKKLKQLEKFIHNDRLNIDPLIKLALIHYQFEAIHPFTDANGRTGRILNVLYLVYMKLIDLPILYLSKYIIENKSQYYRLLRDITYKQEWEPWIIYMLDAVEKSSKQSISKIVRIKEELDKTIETAKEKLPSHVYSKELIELIFEQPYCKIQFLVKKNIAKRQTASQYLEELVKIGVMKKEKFGKENLYLNKNLYKVLIEEG